METSVREPRTEERTRSDGQTVRQSDSETARRTAVCQALAQAHAGCPFACGSRATGHESRSQPPCCAHCIYGGKMRDGDQAVPICANTANAPGEIVRIDPQGTCPNFCRRCEPIVHGTPPEPPDDSIRYIPLTKGKYAIVDAADHEWLSRYKWHVVAPGKQYAGRKQGGKTIYMHRQIMQPPPGLVVDHIDGNGFNNRRRNLRHCTNQQNMQNLRKSTGGRSLYKGVSYDRRRGTWSAKICHNAKSLHLGTFATEIEAACAYDRKALALFGEFARLNFPGEVERGSGDAYKRRSGEEASPSGARPSSLVSRAGEDGEKANGA